MKKHMIIFIVAASFLYSCLKPPQESDNRSNIISTMADDHTVKSISSYGSKINNPTHIDWLAEENSYFNTSALNELPQVFPNLLLRVESIKTDSIGYWNMLLGQSNDYIEMDSSYEFNNHVANSTADNTLSRLDTIVKDVTHRSRYSTSEYLNVYDSVKIPLPEILIDDYVSREQKVSIVEPKPSLDTLELNLDTPELNTNSIKKEASKNTYITSHKRQFRGVWIATVYNLDWPSKSGLSIRKLKKEYIKHLDNLRDLGMNAVIVQIRPSGDAFYPSELEPWSKFLTGKQGLAPASSFDPLAFIITETHNRSMEFHAWFNPYRGVRNFSEARLSPTHVFFKHPEWFVIYGKDLYFDAGMVPARKFVEKVITDVVTRYDIDAIHFDDYFYPYRIEGEEFPDTLSFTLFPRAFTPETKEDWRRDNVNLLVKELYDTINYIKPWVHFGISPFGVWRNKTQDPNGSDTQTSQTNYDDLFADTQTWLQNGWLDYILPQCYQYLGRDIMDYRVVTRWWNEHNFGTNFYIGQGPYRLGDSKSGSPWTEGNEIARQLYFNDSIPNLLGSAYFRSKNFMDNPLGINDTLKSNFYLHPALPPASHHDAEKTCDIKIKTIAYIEKRRKIKITWESDFSEQVRYYVIYKSNETEKPENIVAITANNTITIKRKALGTEPYNLRITAVDRYRKESQPLKVSQIP